MTPMISKRTISLLLLCSLAPAQSMPFADGRGRQLHLFDLEAIHGAKQAGPTLRLAVPGEASAAPACVDVVTFLRRIVEPPLGEGDDLKLLGDRWLAVLGSPAQIASVERIHAAALAERERSIDVSMQMLKLPKGGFEVVMRELTDMEIKVQATRWEIVMTAEQSARLVAASGAAQVLEMPTVRVRPLQHGQIATIDQTPYVKDFEVKLTDSTAVAEPVMDIVQSGIDVEILATFLAPDQVAFTCDLQLRELKRPIAEFKTTLSDSIPAVTIQLPQVTGVRFEQTARLRSGERMVFAAQQADGSHILTIVSAIPEPRAQPK